MSDSDPCHIVQNIDDIVLDTKWLVERLQNRDLLNLIDDVKAMVSEDKHHLVKLKVLEAAKILLTRDIPNDPESKLHTFTSVLFRDCTTLMIDMDQLKEAADMLRDSIAIWIEFENLKHPSKLNNEMELARALRKMGCLDEARALLEQVLDVFKSSGGSTRVKKFEAMNNLGNILHEQGKFEEAYIMLKEASDGFFGTLGCSNPDTLACLNNVARTLRKLSKFDEAESTYREVLKLKRMNPLIGDEHASTLITMNNLGVFLREDRKNFQAAERLFREVLEIKRRVLGDCHSSTLTSARHLTRCIIDKCCAQTQVQTQAQTQDQNEDIQEAILLAREVLLGFEHLAEFGNADPADTVLAMNDLATVLFFKTSDKLFVAEASLMANKSLELINAFFAKAREDKESVDPRIAEALEDALKIHDRVWMKKYYTMASSASAEESPSKAAAVVASK